MIKEVIDFLGANALWLGLFSVLSLIVASVLAAWLVAWLPEDYFLYDNRRRTTTRHWLIRLLLVIIKNVIGLLLIAAGVVMLFTPGQGLLTLLAGLLLADFPGKYRLERRLARQERVMAVLNWLRNKRGEPPFVTPPP